MLVLTRREHETVFMHTSDGVIKVEVLRSGHQVKLGITAPGNVAIVRNEITVDGKPLTRRRTSR